VHQDFPRDGDALAQSAAQAAHCAHEQDKFWPFYNAVFDKTSTLKQDDIDKSAAQAELDVPAFQRCMASDRPKLAVAQSRADALVVGVKGTPTLFVNGMRLSGVLPLALMQAFIERELSLEKSPS
jgi:protein-disulfide isomerase